MPLRTLMWQALSQAGDSSLQRIESGMAFAKRLEAMQSRYFVENPTVKADLAAMVDDSRNYLTHEYFNHNWQPFYQSEVVEQLAEAKLSYVVSGDIDDRFYNNFKLMQEPLQILTDVPDTTRRETIRDFMFNTRFRRDLFVKGAVKFLALEQVEQLSHTYFALIIDPAEMSYEVALVGCAIQLDQAIYRPMIDCRAGGWP